MMKIERTYHTLVDLVQTEEAFRGRCSLDTNGNPAVDDVTKELFHLLWLRYQKSVVSYTDAYYDHGELVSTEMVDNEAFYDKVNYIYLTTKDRYMLLLNMYKQNKANLLKAVTTAVTVRFNDTPQDGGDWGDDKHSTTIQSEEQSSDYMPLMERIASVENRYHSLMHRWVLQFEPVLGGGEQLYV